MSARIAVPKGQNTALLLMPLLLELALVAFLVSFS